MDPRPRLNNPAPRLLISTGLLALSCFLAGRLGSNLVAVPSAVLNPWACVGVGLAGLLVFGRQAWPGVFIGVWPAAFLVCLKVPEAGISSALLASFAIAIGKTLATVAGWELCSRWLAGSGENVISAMEARLLGGGVGVFKYLVMAPASTLGGCVLGLLGSTEGGLRPWHEFAPSLAAWWAGDATGVLVFSPFMVLVVLPTRRSVFNEEGRKLEKTAALISLCTLVWLVFIGPSHGLLRPFVITLPRIWLALRAGVRLTVVGVMIVSVLAFWNGSWHHNRSPFAASGYASLEAVIYVWVMAVTALTVSLNVAVAKHSRGALRELNQQLEASMAAIPALVFTALDPNMEEVKVNAAAVKTLGLDAPDGRLTLNQSGMFPQFVSPEDGTPVPLESLPMPKAIRTGQPSKDSEIQFVRHTGETFSLLGNAVPLFDAETNSVRGCIAAFLDITARKRAEEALRLKDIQLAMITSITPAMLNQVDAEERFVFANRAYLEHTGLSSDKLMGMTLREVIGEENYSQIRHHIERVFQGHRVEFERESNRGVRGRRVLNVIYTPTKDATGRVNGWVGSIHDVTERARGEERFRKAVEAAPSGMVMADVNGRIVLVNDHAERIFGYDRGELIGLSVNILVPERFRQAHPGLRHEFHLHPEARAMGAGRDLYAVRKDGTEFPVEIGLSPIQTDEGLMVLSSIVDITARKAAEEALRRLNDELEMRVVQRTQELATANTNLVHVAEERRLLKQQILEISEREERRLGMNMHEGIGQQIAGIGFLCNVVASRLVDEKHPQAGTASQLVSLLKETMDSLRDLAKSAYPIELETGGLTTALNGLAERTSKMFHLNCEVIFDDDLGVFYDENVAVHLYRIVQEAVTNAVRHGHAKNIYIEQMHTVDGDELRIVDDGDGFVQPEEGRGMGLHLMDYRARLIGAKLTVKRDGERGCVVKCLLNVSPAQTPVLVPKV